MRNTLIILLALLLAPLAALLAAGTEVAHDGPKWTIANGHIRVVFQADQRTLEVLDKASGYTWRQAVSNRPASKEVKSIDDGLVATVDYCTKGHAVPGTLTLTVPEGSADLRIEFDLADRATETDLIWPLDPVALDTKQAVLVVADYSDGHVYPVDMIPFPARWHDGGRLDLPFVGLCDLAQGQGCNLILETPDDAVVECKPVKVGDKELAAPRLGLLASKGMFGHPRTVLYRFTPKGGYVALAKAYRAYAQAHGLIVTLEEKAKANPNVRRLYGAVDVWGDANLAREAKDAGVERLLVHGKNRPENMKTANDLGFITSEYDNYTDIEPISDAHPLDSNHDVLPDHAVQLANSDRMKAWLTYDKKTQFMKRCPSFWVPSAEQVIPRVLEKSPFLGRFIDVTTAEGLYECYDPQHPLTREDKRHCGEKLLDFVRARKLVVGGEHGIWWGVPYLDYVEGMMSGGHAAWPAGHLIRPKNRDEKFAGPYGVSTWEGYDRFGIGHEYRVPLWELVFHDCVVSTWYWGDSSDFLIQMDPSNQDKKDAFNVLYGTMPMLWANREGGWRKDRERAVKTCRVTGKLNQIIAPTEMLSHDFMTPDRAVQRTTFADGTECVVNFGSDARDVTVGGRSYKLPQYGFAVKGPKIEQSLALEEGKPVLKLPAP